MAFVKRKRKNKVISLKPPKGYKVDNVDTDIVGFRGKGNKPKVGVVFEKIPKAPKYKGKRRTRIKRPRIKRRRK